MAKKKNPYATGSYAGPAGLEYLTGYGPGTSTWSGNSVTTPAASPTPTAPATAPDIRDATYNDAINNAWRNLGNTTASIAGQQALLRGSYGYNPDGSVDLSNPFSRAALLTRTYQQNRAGTQNSYAARGQMTSGAYNRMQGSNLFNYQQGQDALQKSYLQENANLLAQLTGAQNQYGDTASQAAADALARSIQARNASTGAAATPAYQTVRAPGKDGKMYTWHIYADGRRVAIK